MSNLDIIIVEKSGSLKTISVKDFKEEDLFKKCGLKKKDDFDKQVEWKLKTKGRKYVVSVYAKMNGRANNENKYDFPPPIDNHLFFGSCAIVAQNEKQEYISLNIDLWNTLYEKLFGGFEDLAATALEDEQEIDELANVPKEKKTKEGYLKDGFVVSEEGEEELGEDETTSDSEINTTNSEDEDEDDDAVIEDIGSELSEESYDYESDE
jgi:hypothetical protein